MNKKIISILMLLSLGSLIFCSTQQCQTLHFNVQAMTQLQSSVQHEFISVPQEITTATPQDLALNLSFNATGPFSLSKSLDIPLGMFAAGLAVTPILIEAFNKDAKPAANFSSDGHYVVQDKSEVNKFDRLIMNRYSKPLDYTATGIELVSLLAPAFLAFTPSSEWLTIGTMYAQTVLIAYGAKELLKFCVDRTRPYMYFDGAPDKALLNGDWCSSFPSGHTTLTYASAAFFSFTFCKYFPRSKWRIPVVASSYTLAFATAALRIASGNHFMTDVLTGAALGTVCGLCVPLFHYTKTVSKNKLDLSVTPLSASLSINY